LPGPTGEPPDGPGAGQLRGPAGLCRPAEGGSRQVTLFAWLELREELVLGAGQLVAESAGVMMTAVQTYLDQLLFLTALNLFLYWALHGVVLAARSGILEGD
jgi:hypothetical protein